MFDMSSYPNDLEGQMTIFDFLPAPSDLDDLPEEEMVRIVGERTGLKFQLLKLHNDFYQYEAKIGKAKITINYSRYFPKIYHGKRFISVSYMNGTGGGGAPCDTLDEAVEMLKRYIERIRREKR